MDVIRRMNFKQTMCEFISVYEQLKERSTTAKLSYMRKLIRQLKFFNFVRLNKRERNLQSMIQNKNKNFIYTYFIKNSANKMRGGDDDNVVLPLPNDVIKTDKDAAIAVINAIFTADDAAAASIKTILDAHKALTIVKPNGDKNTSKFAIVTYWWGNGRSNKNMQKPCPEEIKSGHKVILSREPKTFEKMIEDWKGHCEAKNCPYIVEEYPEFVKAGMYQHAINAKPLFILKALDLCKKNNLNGVVYIDGDMSVNKYPDIFNTDNVDFMARNWNIDPRSNDKGDDIEKLCFDPYVFETSGGIMYFGDTAAGRQLLQFWHDVNMMPKNKGKADDRILSLIFNATYSYLDINVINLPIEYLWLTDNYKEVNRFKVDSDDVKKTIMFEHPYCLTGEERATELGSSSNRDPDNYYAFSEYLINCYTYGGVFYENIFFDSADIAKSFEPYHTYIKDMRKMADIKANAKVLKIEEDTEIGGNAKEAAIEAALAEASILYDMVDFNHGYGNHQNIVESNKSVCTNALVLLNNNNTFYKTEIITVYGAPYIKNNENIIRILNYLVQGKNVIFCPIEMKQKRQQILNNLTPEIELVCFNDRYDNKYKISFTPNNPIFFSHKSKILRHLLLMCKDINKSAAEIEKDSKKVKFGAGFTDVFRSSFIFLSRIRCKWLYD